MKTKACIDAFMMPSMMKNMGNTLASLSTTMVSISVPTEKGETMKQKLIDCINGVLKHLPWGEISSHTAEDIAEALIEEGLVTTPKNKSTVTVEDECNDEDWGA